MDIREGILPIDKPIGKTSFSLIHQLRKKTSIKKIGHAGTLDPFASGVMILLVGSTFTRQANTFLNQDKEYIATLHLGIDHRDLEKTVIKTSIPEKPKKEAKIVLKELISFYSFSRKDHKKWGILSLI